MTEKKNQQSERNRRTVSLSDTVAKWSEELAEKKGYDNFSAYVADLIRRDKEREDERRMSLAVSDIRVEKKEPKNPSRRPKTPAGSKN